MTTTIIHNFALNFLKFFFFETVLFSPGWPWNHNVSEVDLEFLILLPQLPKCSDYGQMLQYSAQNWISSFLEFLYLILNNVFLKNFQERSYGTETYNHYHVSLNSFQMFFFSIGLSQFYDSNNICNISLSIKLSAAVLIFGDVRN